MSQFVAQKKKKPWVSLNPITTLTCTKPSFGFAFNQKSKTIEKDRKNVEQSYYIGRNISLKKKKKIMIFCVKPEDNLTLFILFYMST